MKFKIKGKPTIGKLIGPYEAAISDHRMWSTKCWAVEMLLDHFGDIIPDSVTRSDVQKFKETLLLKYSPKTVKNICNYCSGFFTFLVHYEFALLNPFRETYFSNLRCKDVEFTLDEIPTVV